MLLKEGKRTFLSNSWLQTFELFVNVRVCVCLFMLMMSRSDDHRADEPKAAAGPSQGAVLPASLHAGAGAHRRPAAPGVVGTSSLVT